MVSPNVVSRPDECRRLTWCRCRHRPWRQAVLPALGRARVARRRRARGWGKHRVDCPCRADATPTALAASASYRRQQVRKYAGTRASRPIHRRAVIRPVPMSPRRANLFLKTWTASGRYESSGRPRVKKRQLAHLARRHLCGLSMARWIARSKRHVPCPGLLSRDAAGTSAASSLKSPPRDAGRS